MQARTNDALVPPITLQELADWLVVDVNDPILQAVSISATDATIQFLGYELLTRTYTATEWDYPFTGTQVRPQVSRPDYVYDQLIPLPYANLISVASVEVFGQATTNFIERSDAIVLNNPSILVTDYKGNVDPAIQVVYDAGYGSDVSDIPAVIRQAIVMAAAYLYEHRGDCAAGEALRKSGAAELLVPYINPRRMSVA